MLAIMISGVAMMVNAYTFALLSDLSDTWFGYGLMTLLSVISGLIGFACIAVPIAAYVMGAA